MLLSSHLKNFVTFAVIVYGTTMANADSSSDDGDDDGDDDGLTKRYVQRGCSEPDEWDYKPDDWCKYGPTCKGSQPESCNQACISNGYTFFGFDYFEIRIDTSNDCSGRFNCLCYSDNVAEDKNYEKKVCSKDQGYDSYANRCNKNGMVDGVSLGGTTSIGSIYETFNDYKQLGCTRYNKVPKAEYNFRAPDLPLTPNHKNYQGNAYTCSEACREEGYPLFGFECPMNKGGSYYQSTLDKVHCQCYNTDVDIKYVAYHDHGDSIDCKTKVGKGGDKHCTGIGMVDGISMGGADIGSVYEVPSFKFQRRLLWKRTDGGDFLSDDNDYYETCKDEKFQLNLFVDTNPHVYFLLSPTEGNKLECLTTLLVHADFNDAMGVLEDKDRRMKKSVHAIGDDDKQEMKSTMDEAIPVGTFSMTKIADAFHASDDGGNKAYDRRSNNCGALLIDMGNHLGIDYYSRPDIVDYVQRRLMGVMDEANNEPN